MKSGTPEFSCDQISLLVHLQTVREIAFGPLSFVNLDQKHVIYFELKFEWTKSETACTSVTGPPNSELDQKLDPRVNSELSKRHTKYVFDSFEQV